MEFFWIYSLESVDDDAGIYCVVGSMMSPASSHYGPQWEQVLDFVVILDPVVVVCDLLSYFS